MAKEVFQLEVQVGTSNSLAGIQNVTKELGKAKAAADSLGKGSSFSGLSANVNTLRTSVSGLSSVLGGLLFGKVASEALTAIRSLQNLETVLVTVAGGVTQAAAAMKLLEDVSANTPFSVNQLGESFIKLKAAGLEPTAQQLTLFSDIASVTTDKIGALQAITDLYARTTAGGLGLEELNRLADRGIPVFDILSKRIGVSRLGLSELGKSAQGAQLILRNLEAGLGSAFSGASSKALDTIDGQFGQLEKNLSGLAVTAGNAGATGGITELIKSLNQLTLALDPIAKVVGGVIGDGLKTMAAGIVEVTTNTLKFVTATAALAAGLVVLPAIFKAAAAEFAAFSALTKYNYGLVTGNLPKMPRVMPDIGDSVFSRAKYMASTTATYSVGVASAAAAGGVDKLFASFSKLTTIVTSGGAALLRFAGLGALLNPVGATIAAIVATLYIFKDTLVTVGNDSASIGEIIIYPFKKLYEWAGLAVDAVKKVVMEMGDFFSIKPPDWLVGLKDWALGGIVKDIANARREKEAGEREAAKFAQQAADAKEAEGKAQEKVTNDAKLAQDLMTARSSTLLKILDGLKQESSLIGKSKQEAEILTKQYELQNSIKQKLLTADPTLTAAELEQKSILSTTEKRQIANEVYKKYQATSLAYFNDMVKGNNLEISLLGKSNNERDQANKLKEIQVQLGMTDAQWSKEKAKYEAEIARTQNAQINESLNKNLEGINKEVEYLKLGNAEREKRIALDQAAADAGFKNADELVKARPEQAAQIVKAIGNKQQTGIDVEGQKQIDQLKEESALLSVLDEQERNRAKNQLDIYKAIDPEGKGKNITDAQKAEVNGLLATIEAQNKLLEINKKIEDSYGSLGDAVSKWVLGASDGIRAVKVELLKLIALEALKYFNGGSSGGISGSFINGIIGGLSGARENGGPVTAGGSYLVGEKRPEIFVPKSDGYIVPNTAMMNTKTGSTHVTMAPNLIIQGSVTGQTELENMFDQFANTMAQETKNFVISQSGQNGILAR